MKTETIRFAGPAGTLEGVVVSAARPSAAVVVAHPHPLYGGTMDNAVVRVAADTAVARGDAVLRFNFRGVGASAGSHDGGRGELGDLEAALTELRLRAPDLPLRVIGYSFGAAVALRLLDPERVPGDLAAVIALAPPVDHYDFSFLDRAARPWALVCGERDALTPRASIERETEGRPLLVSVEWIADTGHDLGTGSGEGGQLRSALERACDAVGIGA